MSGFFGSALTDRSGKFNRQDDFAGLGDVNIDEGYDFEDTYDGLGEQLEEANDDFNDDTFGATTVGRDFDFSGKTANVADTIEEEQIAFQRRQPSSRPAEIDRAPARQAQTFAQVQQKAWSSASPIASRGDIWGQPVEQHAKPFVSSESSRINTVQQAPPRARKFQTLEEIEAALLAPKVVNPTAQQASTSRSSVPEPHHLAAPELQLGNSQPNMMQGYLPPGFHQQPQMPMMHAPVSHQMPPGIPNQNMMRSMPAMPPMPQISPMGQISTQESRQRLSAMEPVIQAPQPGKPPVNFREAMVEDEGTRIAQQQKNLRRAQKIGHMARYNGLMSNGDKNYVLKVQISQLVSEDPEADDFYYTVHSTLRGRNNVQQSLGHYEQTYLHRAGQSNRRGNRDKQNPMLKMQQQVQKIIASAKSRPKSTSLAVEGSLGKLSFSRVRQPKQTINVKMPETSAPLNRQSKKEALQSIEKIYNTLLLLEHSGRQGPPLDAPSEVVDDWKAKIDQLANKIWASLGIMDQVDNAQLHPFIQLLQYSKGKKLIPRLYRNLNFERRLTLITMIVAHLDTLDVIRLARYDEAGNLPREIRDEIELFSQTVLPPLLSFVSDSPMKIIVGLLGMLLERNDIYMLCMSKVGLSFLTMFISRAEIAKQADNLESIELTMWLKVYDRMFSLIEGKFSLIFPPISNYTDEIYPWQFLAACAVSASPEQQHTLVNEARDRVLDNVSSSQKLPKELADVKRSNVNLFLNAIGLDASQLEA